MIEENEERQNTRSAGEETRPRRLPDKCEAFTSTRKKIIECEYMAVLPRPAERLLFLSRKKESIR